MRRKGDFKHMSFSRIAAQLKTIISIKAIFKVDLALSYISDISSIHRSIRSARKCLVEFIAFHYHCIDCFLTNIMEMLLQSCQFSNDLLTKVTELVLTIRLHHSSIALQPAEFSPMSFFHVSDEILPSFL